MIDSALETLRRSRAELIKVERAAQPGDVVEATLEPIDVHGKKIPSGKRGGGPDRGRLADPPAGVPGGVARNRRRGGPDRRGPVSGGLRGRAARGKDTTIPAEGPRKSLKRSFRNWTTISPRSDRSESGPRGAADEAPAPAGIGRASREQGAPGGPLIDRIAGAEPVRRSGVDGRLLARHGPWSGHARSPRRWRKRPSGSGSRRVVERMLPEGDPPGRCATGIAAADR